MGRNIVAVATLLVNSVKKHITILTIRTSAGVGMVLRVANCSASQSERPEACWKQNGI